MHLFQNRVPRILYALQGHLNNRYTKYQVSTGCWLSQNSNFSFAWSKIVYNRKIYILHARLLILYRMSRYYLTKPFQMTFQVKNLQRHRFKEFLYTKHRYSPISLMILSTLYPTWIEILNK